MAEVKVFNVLVPVVSMVSGVSADDAIQALKEALMAAGFEPYEGGSPDADAFESEV